MLAVLIYILISTFLVSLIAFIGLLTLFLKGKLLDAILPFLVAFAAGSLIGNAFLHLIPEAIIDIGVEEELLLRSFLYLIFGFSIFFVLEQFIRWHHHHAREHPDIMPFSYLILISDGLHNFIDGLVIAGAFIVSLPLGITTSLAVAFHEIPQEIGDFGILVYGGFKKTRALFLNFLSAVAAVLGGLAGFFLSQKIGGSIVYLLPFAAGNFIYIASADLIPEIKHKQNPKESLAHFLFFLLGILLMLLIK